LAAADPIVIALASDRDVDAIHDIEQASFPAPWRREFFASEIDASGRLNLVARQGERVVGYLFSMWFLDEMHVNKIAVDEPERRKGIALALMRRCEAFAIGHRIDSISLEVRQSNRGAQDFYAHIGFHPAYRRPRYYPDGEAAVVMMKSLPQS
jgi:ribosomal-protein-alanine N-acetyltransferase